VVQLIKPQRTPKDCEPFAYSHPPNPGGYACSRSSKPEATVTDQWDPRVSGHFTVIGGPSLSTGAITWFGVAGNGDVILFDAGLNEPGGAGPGAVFDQWNPRGAGDATLIGTGMAAFAVAGNGDVILYNPDANGGTLLDFANPRDPAAGTLIDTNVDFFRTCSICVRSAPFWSSVCSDRDTYSVAPWPSVATIESR
jgi:hypothetical protein